MKQFEIRSGATTIIVPADGEQEALELALDEGMLGDGDAGSVIEHDGRPVGADGVDPEEPEADVNQPLHDQRGPYPT